MDAVIEFFVAGMHEAPIALGALVGFAIGGVCIPFAAHRERKRDREFKRALDKAMGRSDGDSKGD